MLAALVQGLRAGRGTEGGMERKGRGWESGGGGGVATGHGSLGFGVLSFPDRSLRRLHHMRPHVSGVR